MKTVMKIALSALLISGGISGNAIAEVTQDCVLTGEVQSTTTSGNRGEVRVKFNDAERGAQAPCSMSRSNTRARVQFKARPEDQLQSMPDGSKVKYRYQRRNGEDQWQLLEKQPGGAI